MAEKPRVVVAQDGCVWLDSKRMPCQCGYNGTINFVFAQARAAIEKAVPKTSNGTDAALKTTPEAKA